MANPQSSDIPPRVHRLKAQMVAHSLDAVICMKPESTFYLSGFNPIIYSEPIFVILTPHLDPILLVHVLRGKHAEASTWTPNLFLYGTWSNITTLAPTWPAALTTLLGDGNSKRIGVEQEFLPVTQFHQLVQALPTAQLADCTALIHQCRELKDADEIASARIAAQLADRGMEAAVAALQLQGATERDVVLASMRAMHEDWAAHYPDVEICDFGSLEGGYTSGLTAWVLSGPRQSFGCDNPVQRVPQAGETVSVFVWTVANGMHAELERTVCIGSVAASEKEALHATLDIRGEIALRLTPGTAVGELYETAKKGYDRRGYGEYLPGRIGHSIGLGPHELFSIDARSDRTLLPGMIVSLEPHIHIDGVASTQYSDTILITEDGHECLTRFPARVIQVAQAIYT
ncbi:M24 family metallopeptidase [Aspergillus homomorphus CBS 101889]|uniref:Probable Xaa-Pro aminopeptidase P n=1 Tax=Aspergillus homomorphus (strain CBS 101889) TaxID=1450537 RepID=A0A395I7B5_ASPHC|nr:Xaa-Pro aminopeptidase [Aspergillus homomorphus CBS 101889]RAL15815.1 Xaa-Pro aminopeptidase [Aspergillus homomorphus CBS 101889]